MPYTGTILNQQIRNEESYVHGQGWTTTHEFVGTHSGIEGLLWSYTQNGWNVHQTFEGPYARMVATRGGRQEYAKEDYYDKFSITKETLQKAIWTLPEVVENMQLYATYTSEPIQKYKSSIEEAVSSGDEAPLIQAIGPSEPSDLFYIGWCVYWELCRGAESWETEYIIMTRERMVSVEYYETDVMPIPPLNAARIFPSSDILAATFSIPYLPGVTWPDDPPLENSDVDLQWGWRERRREIVWEEGARVGVIQDFAFAEWSTNLYEVQT